MRKINPILLALMILFSCSNAEQVFAQDSAVPDHEGWTALLEEYVDDEGMVDYQGFINDKTKLDAYTQLLSDNPPAQNWTKEEQLAYWINAYNAFTIKLIVDNYPVESIKDLNPTVAIPFVNTIWRKKWFQLGGEDFSLDMIEHSILRRDFNEPRIHFAVNCASISCPVLRAEAYEPDRIDAQLEEQTKLFLNDASRNDLNERKPRVSKIFSWFTEDFTKGQTLVEFINRYAEAQLDEKVRLRYMDYDWSLNDQGTGN